MPNAVDLTGKRFGRLVARKVVYVDLHLHGKPFKRRAWDCLCDCGKSAPVQTQKLLSGHTTSCGCFNREKNNAAVSAANRRHGGTGTAEYQAWLNMRKRCLDPNLPAYKNYGGRGITICERWESFENFLADMGMKPSPKLTLERKNNNGNYEPGNCKWATRKEQRANQRTPEEMQC